MSTDNSGIYKKCINNRNITNFQVWNSYFVGLHMDKIDQEFKSDIGMAKDYL